MRASRFPNLYRWLRLLLAGLILAAVLTQGWESITAGGVKLLRYFSYFTVQSNLLLAGLFAWKALRPTGDSAHPVLPILRAGAVLYLLITGIVYSLLLADLPEIARAVIPWTDFVMHKLAPLAALADWLLDAPGRKLHPRQAWCALAYPLTYALLSLLRGALTGWYPYPFLKPTQPGGWLAVALTCLVITLASLPLHALVIWLGRKFDVHKTAGV